MKFCSDYLPSESVVLCGMRRPNALNVDVIATAMPRRDLFCLLTYCRVRRPNALNLDVICNGALS
jgi:hypothetical protein